ncbi:Glycosylphosphatidylinositol-anchor biosynthesis protein 7 [Intoshia linei]|uniref:Glycosylphosphatidylinositol-anchor biosynthesis protein 7 n=1 Tax=Intoshia linei TaxID=1819745 RepID=A0A177B690_9BILA|nr:Glycosylphosphatidylinositol-anchor biosynthesis protein 7 [Intoshia linei]
MQWKITWFFEFVGIYMFIIGFLLIKQVSIDKNECINYENINLENLKTAKLSEIFKSCNKILKTKKGILIIIDGLRYDFAMWNETNPKESYKNRLSILKNLLKFPKKCQLYKIKCDAPTTTTQRIKAISTGTIPSLVEISQNFISDSVQIDSILYQFFHNKRNLAFMGDDTWHKLFPSFISDEYAFESFDIFDIYSNDVSINSNIDHVFKSMWDFLIVHYLGVDHVGHSFNDINHREMAIVLDGINENIANIVQLMDNDTILFIIGDHGMTPSGNHGGDSEDETNSALFIYSPGQEIFTDLVTNKTAYQTDFVPTFASLMGIPIPFGNMGQMLPNLRNVDEMWYIKSLHKNAVQIYLYLRKMRLFDVNIESKLYENIVMIGKILNKKERNETIYLQKHSESLEKVLASTITSIRSKWTKFNVKYMHFGIYVLTLCFFLKFLNFFFHDNKIQPSFMIGSVILYGGLYFLNFVDKSFYLYFLFFLLINIFYFFKKMTKFLTSIKFSDFCLYHVFYRVIVLCIMIMLIIIGYANSYIENESILYLYFVSLLIFFKFNNMYAFFDNNNEINGNFKKWTTYIKNWLNYLLNFNSIVLLRFACEIHRGRDESLESTKKYMKTRIYLSILVVTLYMGCYIKATVIYNYPKLFSLLKPQFRTKVSILSTLQKCMVKYIPSYKMHIIDDYYYFVDPNSNIVNIKNTNEKNKNLQKILLFIPFLFIVTSFFIILYSWLIDDHALDFASFITITISVVVHIYCKLLEKYKLISMPIYSIPYYHFYWCLIMGREYYYCSILYFILFYNVMKEKQYEQNLHNQNRADQFSLSLILFLLIQLFFFLSGHHNTFSSIQWRNAFFRFENKRYLMFIPFIIIVFNTFSNLIYGIPVIYQIYQEQFGFKSAKLCVSQESAAWFSGRDPIDNSPMLQQSTLSPYHWIPPGKYPHLSEVSVSGNSEEIRPKARSQSGGFACSVTPKIFRPIESYLIGTKLN